MSSVSSDKAFEMLRNTAPPTGTAILFSPA
jgi:hypothetical protein